MNNVTHLRHRLILKGMKIYRHHLARFENDGHRDINVVKGVHPTPYKTSVELNVAVHPRANLQALDDNSEQGGVDGYFLALVLALIYFRKNFHKFRNLRLGGDAGMRYGLPAFGGHI